MELTLPIQEKTTNTAKPYKRLKALLRTVKQHNIAEFRDPCGANYHITLDSLDLEDLITQVIKDKYLLDNSECCDK
jgi:hypothetical protein